MTDGTERKMLANEDYIRKSVLEPNGDVVKGFPPIMPLEKMTEDEIHELIQYIKELR
jgi:cytochrome c oxidase subunit 2